MSSNNTRTIKPRQALEEYLSALLTPSTKAAAGPTPKAEAVKVQERPSGDARELSEQEKESLQRTLLTSLRVQPEAPKPAEPQPVAAKVEAKTAVEPAVKKPAPAAKPAETPAPARPTKAGVDADFELPDHWLANGRPEWAQERFECLLFSVAGLKLAVPLVCLGGIHAVTDADEMTPLPGMPDWFVGLMPTGQGNLRVVDTARWVMPERNVQNYKDQMRYVIRINGSDWGLACDLVDKSFRMVPDDVRWRTGRSKRPWLAGTVIEHMCALMDVDAFDRLLKESERRNKYRKV